MGVALPRIFNTFLRSPVGRSEGTWSCMSTASGILVMLVIFGLYGYFAERGDRRRRAITAAQRREDTDPAIRLPGG
jgi:hypothetical protein